MTSHFGDLEFDLLRLLKVKCEGVIGHHTYGYLLMFNSNIWPNMGPLQDKSLQNMSDLDFDRPSFLKVKSNGEVGLPIYDFLLVSNSNHMCISNLLGVIATQFFFFHFLPLGPNVEPLIPTLTPGDFF